MSQKKIKSSVKRKEKKSKPVYDGVTFDSNLEVYCYRKLKENNLKFSYHAHTFELLEKFTSNVTSWEPHSKYPGILKVRTDKYQNMSHTPDFVGKHWIIETKGLLRSKDQMTIKLFKYHLLTHNYPYKHYFLPGNHAEVDFSIAIIKLIENNDIEMLSNFLNNGTKVSKKGTSKRQK